MLDQTNRLASFVDKLEDIWDQQGPPQRLEDFDPVLELSRQVTATPKDKARLCTDCAEFILADGHPRGMSYRHQHGFSKLSLYRSPRHTFNIRIHIWWDSDIADESPHEHRWPFCSTVLSGSLRITNFVLDDPTAYDDGKPDLTDTYVQHKFYDADKSGAKVVERTGPVELKTAVKVRVVGGAQHMLWHDQPHQVFGDGDRVAATFLITGAACRDYSNVYRQQSYDTNKRKLDGLHLTADQIADELRRYAGEFA